MARRITLKYPATCKECGADLPAGIKARYYGKGRVYGIDCHEDTRTAEAKATKTRVPRGPRGGVPLSELSRLSDEQLRDAAEDHVEGGADYQLELANPLG
jgi:hypothetical protein